MNRTRDDTLFALRYAVRVLERHARMWGLIGTACKFTSVLSGTVALAALVGTNTPLAVSMGVLFATLQAIEHAFGPAEHRAKALAQRREYARVLAAHVRHDDAALEAAYQAIVAEDDITVMPALKELAFNDVVREHGLNEGACYSGHGLLRALS